MTHSNESSPILAEILRFNAQRKPRRVQMKLLRMSQDAFSFFRGTDHLLASRWLHVKPPDVGPAILLCGDLHLENFGAYETNDGDFLYDINDFDEALVAPCSLDLVRCTASILVASEMWKLTPLQASGMALAFLDQYRAAVTAPPHVRGDATPAPYTGRGPIWELLGETALASPTQMLDHHTEQTKAGKRRIIRDKTKHPTIKNGRVKEIRQAIASYGRGKPNPEAYYEALDVTGRIAGTGGLGVRRYIALIAGGGTPDTNWLLDIKECLPSSLLSCTDAPQPDTGGDDARRIVDAQRSLQAKPAKGLDVLVIGKGHYRMREMVPDENRTSLRRFQKAPDKLRQAVEVAGQLTGWSHLRGARHHERTDNSAALVAWAAGPALDAVLAAAARYAEQTRLDFLEFTQAVANPKNLPKSLRTDPSVNRVKSQSD